MNIIESTALVVEASRLKEQLRKWIDEIHAQTACGLGIKNYLHDKSLTNPRVFLAEGTALQSAEDNIKHEQASASLYGQREYSRKGTSGCLCYDIENTGYMIAIMWAIQPRDEEGENRFNIRCVKTGECNRALFRFLSKNSRRADGEVVEEENGFRLCGCIGRESKAIFIVDIYDERRVGPFIEMEAVRSGRQLEARLREWVNQTGVKNACGVGVNNLSSVALLNPKVYLFSGICIHKPVSAVMPQMASASLFCKREYSLLGTSGCFTYDFKDSNKQLAVLWYIAINEVLQENRFYAGIIEKTDCNEALYNRLWKETRRARDGEVMKEEGVFQVFARMEFGPKAVLIVSMRPKKQWSLW